jgi:hypothetical protein
MVKAGHRETISSATALSLTLSGVQIIGLGSGQNRPTFTLDTANTTTVNVLATDVSIQNCVFVANFLNIASLFTLGGASVTASISGEFMTVTVVGSGTLYDGQTLNSATAGFVAGTKIITQISGTTGGVGVYKLNRSQTVASGTVTTVAREFHVTGCDIRDTSSILNFLAITTTSTADNAADGLTLDNNLITLAATSGAVLLLSALGTNDRVQITNNRYRARTVGTGAVIPIATGKILTNFLMAGNVFDLVMTSGVTTGILITTNGSTNSGVLCNNYVKSLDDTSEILVTASSGFIFYENYAAAAADTSGFLRPAADS